MIGWLQPGAFYGLVLAAAPILIHLLRTRRAERMKFPTIRFIRPSITAAVRLRMPSDWILLGLRTGIVAMAVCALAQPVLLTPSRLDAWNAVTARAILVDVGGSMHIPGSDGRRPSDAAEEAAAAEQQGAAHVVRFDSVDLPRELMRAAAWLRDAPPARREVVIISDLQRGTIEESDLVSLPAGVGIRFADVGAPDRAREVEGFARFGIAAIPERTHRVTLSPDETGVTIGTRHSANAQGVRLLIAPGEATDAERMLSAVAVAGAPAPSAEQAVAFVFPSGAAPAPAPVTEMWMLRTVLRLQQDDQVQRLARRVRDAEHVQESTLQPDVWTVIARDDNDGAVVRAAASGGELIVSLAAPVSSLLAAAVVRATLAARYGSLAQPEAEVSRVSGAMLRAWSRTPAPVEQDAWRRADSSDARWCWLAALALLGVEQWLRSRPVRERKGRVARAAA